MSGIKFTGLPFGHILWVKRRCVSKGLCGSSQFRGKRPVMKMRSFPHYAAAILLCAAVLPAQAQWSAGDTGAQKRRTDTTWQDVRQQPAPGNFGASVGRTFRTAPQTLPGLNGPALPYSDTALEATKSGMDKIIPSGQYDLGFPQTGPDTYRGPYQSSSQSGGTLPQTSTSSVNADTVDFSPMASSASCLKGDEGGTGYDGGDNAKNLPPSPGPGYQPIYQHGVFVGYMSPEESAMYANDAAAAWRSFANSARYVGGAGLRASLLYEIGDIDSPFNF